MSGDGTKDPFAPLGIDLVRDVLGVEQSPERLAALAAAYGEALVAIKALRELDLTEVHPAVIFDPMVPYRGEGE